MRQTAAVGDGRDGGDGGDVERGVVVGNTASMTSTSSSSLDKPVAEDDHAHSSTGGVQGIRREDGGLGKGEKNGGGDDEKKKGEKNKKKDDGLNKPVGGIGRAI